MTRYTGHSYLNENLGKRIREFRKLRGWSAEKLSEMAGGKVSAPAIYKIEGGFQGNLSFTQGMAIAHALGVAPESLLDQELPEDVKIIGQEFDAARKRLTEILRILNDSE